MASEPLLDEDELAALVVLVRSLNVDVEDLDELVHDLCDRTASAQVNDGQRTFDEAHEAAGRRAADINNGGLDDQCTFLLTELGFDCAREQLIEIF
jgi:type II secretory pathway component PulK